MYALLLLGGIRLVLVAFWAAPRTAVYQRVPLRNPSFCFSQCECTRSEIPKSELVSVVREVWTGVGIV